MYKAIAILSFLILFGTLIFAQNTSKWSVELGTSYRVNKSDNLKGLGVLVSRKIAGDFWLQTGILYKNKKEEFESEIITGNKILVNDVELRLDYLSIPLMLRYNSNFFNIGLGTNYERYINSKDLSNNPLVETNLSFEDENKWYLSGYIGVPISITNNLEIEPGALFNYHSKQMFTDINLSFRYLF